MNETQFVRGIAWHDIAKPFYLGSPKHSRTGFLLLAAAGYPEEAKAALCHVSGSKLRKNLEAFFPLHQQSPLPAVLLLGNALDRLAASTYSLMEDPPENPPFEAWHNPFTRLPEKLPALDERFWVKSHERVDKIDRELQKAMLSLAPETWREDLDDLLKKGDMIAEPLFWPDQLESVASGDRSKTDPIELLYEYSRFYPERTYPPVNDTILSEHTRLSGVFAWVVYHNLKADDASSAILDWTITLKEDQAWLPDPERTDAVDFVSPKHDAGLGYAPGQKLVRDHLAGHLVRISFSGHRQLVDDAARLDDLNGAQVLTAQMRQAFKRALAEKLEVADLAEFLWISESAFDLVYLMPQALGNREDLERLIHDSYEAAVDWLVDDGDNDDSLQELLRDDFQRADPPLAITAPEQIADLKRQLLSLVYNLHIARVQPPTDAADYDAFTAAYGGRLLDAYQSSQAQQLPHIALEASVAALRASEEAAREDVCTVCGTHPVYTELADRVPEDEFLKKVTHTFRQEPERPCLACVTRRALAHKQVQVDVLQQMLTYDAATKKVQVQAADAPKLELPPAMSHGAEVKGRDDFVDMGAAFVRLARRRDAPHPLDIFPTVSYAADRMGNVALLTLSVTEGVFGKYNYRPARQRLERASETERNSPVWDTFAKDYDAFCQRVAEKMPDLLDQVEVVQPHLARVLVREMRISRFFERLATRLEKAGVRTLALDTTYPAGRWLVPAMSLAQALETLGKSVAADLLAVPEEPADEDDKSDGLAKTLDGATRCFLDLTTPPLLDGTAVVFKQKFPIYLVLEAERVLRAELAARQPATDDSWYGVHLALADLRGTLTNWALSQGDVTLDALPELLDLNRAVDRRTVLLRARTAQHITPALADALTVIRADHVRLPQELADKLQEEAIFKPVLFLTKATRG